MGMLLLLLQLYVRIRSVVRLDSGDCDMLFAQLSCIAIVSGIEVRNARPIVGDGIEGNINASNVLLGL